MINTKYTGRVKMTSTFTPKVLAAHDITPLLTRSAPNTSTFPLAVTRSYEVSADDMALVIKFNVSLPAEAAHPVHIGGLGFPMPEGDGHPPSGIETSCWNEAHIGLDHGFVEYVRVVDDEATLLVTAEPGYNKQTKFGEEPAVPLVSFVQRHHILCGACPLS
jgi:hypothetical protein